ncbi:MAG: DUF309 domain-containing protein [Pirellulaceae bacterium]
MSAVDPPRYTQRPFPPYSYVPGQSPHPLSDPAGHSFGRHDAPLADDAALQAAYRYGNDLFNYGYYWEAHEAWESAWHFCGRRGGRADFLKGLIKLAAAGVKLREGKAVGIERHAARARALFAAVPQSLLRDGRILGLDLPSLLTAAHQIEQAASALIEGEADETHRRLPLRLILHDI